MSEYQTGDPVCNWDDSLAMTPPELLPEAEQAMSGEPEAPWEDAMGELFYAYEDTKKGLKKVLAAYDALAEIQDALAPADPVEGAPITIEWRVEYKGPWGWNFFNHTRDPEFIEKLAKNIDRTQYRMIPLYTHPAR